MIRDNTRLGYYLSIALHATVAVAAILCVAIKALFPEEQKHIDPFEMVDLPKEQPQDQPPQVEEQPKIDEQQKLEKIALYKNLFNL